MKTVKQSKQATKALRKMPAHQAKNFHKAFNDILAGRPESHNVNTMHGRDKGRLRFRKGDLRAIVEWMDKHQTLMVVRILPRGEAYKQRR